MLFVLNAGRSGSQTVTNVLSQHPALVSAHEPVPRLIEETARWRYGEVPTSDLVAELRASRSPAIDGRMYCETANRLSLATPVLAEAFPEAKFIWLIRDGRNFVSSGHQRGWYDPNRVADTPWERHRLQGDRLGDVEPDVWKAWSPFRKICWLWTRTNELIENDLAAMPETRSMIVRLEALEHRLPAVEQILDLDRIDWVVPRLNARAARPDTGVDSVNAVSRNFTFRDWDAEQRGDFDELCGQLMSRLYASSQLEAHDVVPTPLEEIRIELAGLRTLQAEQRMLTQQTIRVDRRNKALQAEIARRDEKLNEAKAQLNAASQSLQDAAALESVLRSEVKGAQARARIAEAEEVRQRQRARRQRDRARIAEGDLKRAERRLSQIRNSWSYRLGHPVVRLATYPRRLARRALRPLASPAVTSAAPVDDSALRAKEPARAPSLELRVGGILDEFTMDCFAPEFELFPLDRAAGPAQLEGMDLLFVESAWRGNDGSWNYTINQFDKHGEDVRSLVEAARQAQIPSVFWNKEDPVSFDLFLPAAKAFDIVLTTDADMIDGYRRATGHERVAALPFAAQPRLHNPIGRARGADVAPRVCFAGSWRGEKYPQRGDDFDTLLRVPLERGILDIYDRYAGSPDEAKLGFPQPYRSAVIGSLPYSQIGKAYRGFSAFLNVNSVSESPTMFSRRVFELMACGSPVISTPARGIDEILGDAVLVTTSAEQTAEYVDWAVHEPEARDRFAHRGYRLVHGRHTYRHRVDDLLGFAGIETSRSGSKVSVLCVSNRPEQLDHLIGSYQRQSYIDTEFVFVANSDGYDDAALQRVESEIPGAQAFRLDESASLGDCLNLALEHANGEYFAKFDDDDHYGEHFLADLVLAFGYTDAAVVGKQTYVAYLEGSDRTVVRFPGGEYRKATRVIGGTIVADRSKVGDIRFESVPGGTDSRFLEAVKDAGLEIFSADRYNFCQVRRADPTSHTWAIDDEEFLRNCVAVGHGLRTDAFIV